MREQDPGRKRVAIQATKDSALSPQTLAKSKDIRAIVVFTGTPQSLFSDKTFQKEPEAQEKPTQLIRTREDIGQMREAEKVHLSRQSVVAAEAIQRILDPQNYPYLEEIEIPNRLAARLVKRRIPELIQAQADRGIVLVIARYKDKIRTEQKPGKKQAEKKQLFEELELKKRKDYYLLKR